MSGGQFPSTLIEAVALFSNEEACMKFWTLARWGENVKCPHCQSDNVGLVQTRKIWNCRSCRKQFSIKTQSLMEDSGIPLVKWALAVWLFANTKNGVTSIALARDIRVTQKTAWFMLHRIREAMSDDGDDMLGDQVEVDETYIGGKERNKHRHLQERFGGGKSRKLIVAGIATVQPGGTRVRLQIIERADAPTLQSFVRRNVAPGATVHTDDAAAYKGLDSTYNHRSVDHSKFYVNDQTTTNHLEAFWTQLKGMWRAYVSFDPRHAAAYLQERAFRFNYRNMAPGGRFLLLARSMFGRRLKYDHLVPRRR